MYNMNIRAKKEARSARTRLLRKSFFESLDGNYLYHFFYILQVRFIKRYST